MTKTYKIISGLILLVFAILIYAEASKPNPVNWYPSYGKNDKIPYGINVFYTLLKKQRTNGQFVEVNRPPFEFMNDNNDVEGTYFFVNSSINFDEAEMHKMLDWVDKGNSIFVASHSVSQTLKDTLSLETEAYYDLDNFNRQPLVNLSNPELKKEKPYHLDIDATTFYFTEIDTLKTTVLGVYDLVKNDTLTITEPKVNFVKQSFGDGEIYIHLFPEAFTNYFMLQDDNGSYTNDVQRYLNKNDVIYWDNHFTNSKTFYSSPLYLLFKNRYLKWAWYVLLIGVFAWVIFEGKRKQRAIPVVKPLTNQTVAYTHTIAGMYLEKKDHKSIAMHQINHFFEYLRSTHLLDTSKLGLAFIQRVSAKTDKPIDQTKKLIDFIQHIDQKPQITQFELERLTKMIEAYKTI